MMKRSPNSMSQLWLEVAPLGQLGPRRTGTRKVDGFTISQVEGKCDSHARHAVLLVRASLVGWFGTTFAPSA